MNFKSLIVVGLGIATLGLSLPAHADTATVSNVQQSAVVTGSFNQVTQASETNISIYNRGHRRNNSGTVTNTRQVADISGYGNTVTQGSSTNIRHRIHR